MDFGRGRKGEGEGGVNMIEVMPRIHGNRIMKPVKIV
jgi:hypothetical protein